MKLLPILLVLCALISAAGAIAWDEGSSSGDKEENDGEYGGTHMIGGDEVVDKVMAVVDTTAKEPVIILEKSDIELDIEDGVLVDEDFIADNPEIFEEKTLEDSGLDYLAAQDVRYILRSDSGDRDTFPFAWQAWQVNDFATNVMPVLNEQIDSYPFGFTVEKDISKKSRADNWLEYKFIVPVDEDYESLVFTYDYRLDGEDVVVQLTVEEGGETTTFPPQVYAASD